MPKFISELSRKGRARKRRARTRRTGNLGKGWEGEGGRGVGGQGSFLIVGAFCVGRQPRKRKNPWGRVWTLLHSLAVWASYRANVVPMAVLRCFSEDGYRNNPGGGGREGLDSLYVFMCHLGVLCGTAIQGLDSFVGVWTNYRAYTEPPGCSVVASWRTVTEANNESKRGGLDSFLAVCACCVGVSYRNK